MRPIERAQADLLALLEKHPAELAELLMKADDVIRGKPKIIGRFVSTAASIARAKLSRSEQDEVHALIGYLAECKRIGRDTSKPVPCTICGQNMDAGKERAK